MRSGKGCNRMRKGEKSNLALSFQDFIQDFTNFVPLFLILYPHCLPFILTITPLIKLLQSKYFLLSLLPFLSPPTLSTFTSLSPCTSLLSSPLQTVFPPPSFSLHTPYQFIFSPFSSRFPPSLLHPVITLSSSCHSCPCIKRFHSSKVISHSWIQHISQSISQSLDIHYHRSVDNYWRRFSCYSIH